ncbi:MAG TPA: hypothetical protein VLE74_03975 [Candidatus Saccharimonadales bacterium]|nr:hypothetical protein [Candidatus Saccharimonadales bacterium]
MRRRLTQEVPSFQQLPLDGIEAIIMGNNEVRYVQEVTADTDRKNIDTRLIKTALRAGSTACRDTMLVCGRPFIMPSPVIGDTRLHLAMGLQPARDHSAPYKAARSFARGVLLNLVTTNTAIPLAKTRNDTTLGRSEVAMSLGTVESPDVLQALNERHLGYFSAMYADQELLFGQPVVRTEATQVPQTAFGSS